MRTRANRALRLPDVLRLAYKHGGADCLIRLHKTVGGRRLQIPRQPSDTHPLTIACGRKAADAIAREFAGIDMEFPRATRIINLLLAAPLVEAGKSHNEVAEALKVHWRTARRLREDLLASGIPQLNVEPVRKRRKVDPRQADLEDLLAP